MKKLIGVGEAGATTNSYTVSLSGTNVVPPQANGYTGSATMTIDTDTFEICLQITTNIPDEDLPTEATVIGAGAAGVDNGTLVSFGFTLDACTTSNASIVGDIVADPSSFYLQVDTDLFSRGALRGQLVLVPTSTTTIPTTGSVPVSTTSSPSSNTTTVDGPDAPAADPISGSPSFTG